MKCDRRWGESLATLVPVIALSSSLLISGCGLDILKKGDPEESGPVEVLFIGNSLTGEGDTPAHFTMLSEGAG